MAFGLPSVAEMTDYIRTSASRFGIDPNAAIKAARSEGLAPNTWQSNFSRNGVREPSYGPFQLLVGGAGTGYGMGLGNEMIQQTGLDPSDPANWKAGVDFALEHASKKGWGAWYGTDRVGMSDWEGIGVGATSNAGAGVATTGASPSADLPTITGWDFINPFKGTLDTETGTWSDPFGVRAAADDLVVGLQETVSEAGSTLLDTLSEVVIRGGYIVIGLLLFGFGLFSLVRADSVIVQGFKEGVKEGIDDVKSS